jgi:formylglycine-generating enzyme required for sulfatase activity
MLSLVALLSGCIVSKTPNTNDVNIPFGEQVTFSVVVFPPTTAFAWTLDEVPLSNAESSYLYTAQGGEHFLTVKATHVLGTDTQTWHIITPSPPVANAGADQSVTVDTTVTLDGSGSTDPDNDIVSYLWHQIGGPTVALTNADAAIAQFTATVTIGSVLTFELTVTDAGGLQATDTCVITVSNLSDPISALLSSMVSIPGGTLQMGSTDNTFGWAMYDTPVHEVTLAGFEIGAYEVTQAQYAAVMGTNPSYYQGPGTENNPVEMVNWYEAREFCTQLSAQTGRTFTLPSEAQWEYACRAGSTTLYSFGDDDGQLGNYAWYGANSNGITHPVGTKLPNVWGLYDMHGNVLEWCLDSWHSDYTGAPTDGSAWEPETGPTRMVRGGCFAMEAWLCRSAIRLNAYTESPSFTRGFRVVAVPAGG